MFSTCCMLIMSFLAKYTYLEIALRTFKEIRSRRKKAREITFRALIIFFIYCASFDVLHFKLLVLVVSSFVYTVNYYLVYYFFSTFIHWAFKSVKLIFHYFNFKILCYALFPKHMVTFQTNNILNRMSVITN